jgi:two-component system, chemotaxis family, chemotaxis protein CheY
MLNVLVVDDSMVARKSLIAMLVQMGHKIVGEAKNGREAIDAYIVLSPDLIMMDITMPEMDGIESVMEIRKISHVPKIIMATSHGQEEVVHKAIRAGACGYILKPTTYDKLEKTIHKIFPEIAVRGDNETGEADADKS